MIFPAISGVFWWGASLQCAPLLHCHKIGLIRDGVSAMLDSLADVFNVAQMSGRLYPDKTCSARVRVRQNRFKVLTNPSRIAENFSHET